MDEGSASGGNAPSGRVTSLLLAVMVAQTSVSAGSRGSGGSWSSAIVVPTGNGRVVAFSLEHPAARSHRAPARGRIVVAALLDRSSKSAMVPSFNPSATADDSTSSGVGGE